ncbi:hypothetical protein [Acetobacter okinawensis]|uniref:hypothetical protein n=1 Tax=Acetobacter okinawensis TaxID=1076594 RepID=UPI0020A1109A|nr:hypothetical protein [Acetobacter okinawensis]MCP1212293.1 hypothetical protein [Acetobacter okinawensis]
MKSTDDRKLFGTPIGASAASGNIAAIPQIQATAGDGTASVALGFPPETFIARAAGGEPPPWAGHERPAQPALQCRAGVAGGLPWCV